MSSSSAVKDCNNQKLLENRKRARKKSINDRQFLIAISDRNLEEVNNLLSSVDINFEDRDGCSPLHWAAETGDVKIIRILLNNGAQLQNKNNEHETPVDIAKRIHRYDIVNILEKSLYAKGNSKTKTKNSKINKIESTTLQGQKIWINPIHGYIYQLKLLMLFLHRGLSCKYSFRLGTEIKEAQKFDDLVFEYIHNNKKVYRLLQAKHKFDESKKITVDKLLKETGGDFSLVKYFDSFQACKNDNFFKEGTIKDVIICTNIDFDFEDLTKSGIKVMKLEEKDDILDVISNEKEPTKYRFTNSIVSKLKLKLNSTVCGGEIEEFFNHLIFAVNQPNEEELGKIVKKEIGKEMGFLDTEFAYYKLYFEMTDLSLGKRNSMFLSHEEGKKFFDGLKKNIPIWFNIQDPITSFTGRSKYLNLMHKTLENSFVCISGMGGVGKTELVRKYIAVHGQKYKNQVVWINAESYRSAVDSFRQLASDKLNISLQTSDGQEKQTSSIVADVYQFFSKGTSLFIFDNAEKYKSKDEFDCGIDKFLPCLPENCVKPNIIVTSRYQKWPGSIKVIELETFNVEEARELVEKMLVLESDVQKEMIDELCKKLQFLPLALQQAVAYIKIQKEKLACIDSNFEISNYLGKYSDMTQELLDFEFSEDSDSSYNRSVFATWNITFDALKQKENGSDALDILNIMSYLLPDNIPVELLLVFLPNTETLSSAIALLKQYSLVTIQHKALGIHRLVQQVARIKLQKRNDEVNMLQKMLKLLKKEILSYKNIDHVISVWKFATKHSQLLEEYSILPSFITSQLLDCARYDEGFSIGNEALTLLKAYPNDVYAQIGALPIKNNIAMCKLEKGEYKKALQELQELFELEKIMLGPSNMQILTTKRNIAVALRKLGRNSEALKCELEILDAYRKDNVEESNPAVLLTKHDISCLLAEEGKYEEALSMLQKVYYLQKQVLGDRHADTLKSKNHLAAILGKMNKIDESLKMLNEVCFDQEAILPKNHRSILSTKYSIAGALVTQNKYTLAMKNYQEIFDIQHEQFGDNHPKVINLNVRMAVILKLQNKYEKALKIYREAFDRLKVILGLGHPETLQTQSEIADIFIRQEKYADALEIYKDLLDKQMSILGENHPDTIQTRRYVLLTLEKLKKYDAALEYSLETLNIFERIFGINHPSTFTDKQNVGMMYYVNKDFDKALAILTQVLELQEKSLGKDHEDCRKTKNNIAGILAERAKREREKRDNERLADLERLVNEKGFDINGKDAEGRTILHHAVDAVDERGVKLLLHRGAEIFVKSNKGNTPLHIAVLKGQERIVKILLQKLDPGKLKEFVDVKTTTSASTALHVAAKLGQFSIVKCLLTNCATFCATNKKGETPLDLSTDAKITGFLKMVHELFESVKHSNAAAVARKLKSLSEDEFLAVTNTRNNQGSTLTQVAILNNQKPVATVILQMLKKP